MADIREVTIEGITPLLMHRYPLEPIVALEKKSPEEQARLAAYVLPDGELYIPGMAVQRGLIASAVYSKGKGRASLQKQVAACLFVWPEHILLNQRTFEVDARPVTIPSTKGRVVRYRPRFDKWRATFSVEWDSDLLTEAQVRTVVDDLGQRVGILDFRPERKGPYGRFMVTNWNARPTQR